MNVLSAARLEAQFGQSGKGFSRSARERRSDAAAAPGLPRAPPRRLASLESAVSGWKLRLPHASPFSPTPAPHPLERLETQHLVKTARDPNSLVDNQSKRGLAGSIEATLARVATLTGTGTSPKTTSHQKPEKQARASGQRTSQFARSQRIADARALLRERPSRSIPGHVVAHSHGPVARSQANANKANNDVARTTPTTTADIAQPGQNSSPTRVHPGGYSLDTDKGRGSLSATDASGAGDQVPRKAQETSRKGAKIDPRLQSAGAAQAINYAVFASLDPTHSQLASEIRHMKRTRSERQRIVEAAIEAANAAQRHKRAQQRHGAALSGASSSSSSFHPPPHVKQTSVPSTDQSIGNSVLAQPAKRVQESCISISNNSSRPTSAFATTPAAVRARRSAVITSTQSKMRGVAAEMEKTLRGLLRPQNPTDPQGDSTAELDQTSKALDGMISLMQRAITDVAAVTSAISAGTTNTDRSTSSQAAARIAGGLQDSVADEYDSLSDESSGSTIDLDDISTDSDSASDSDFNSADDDGDE